MIKQHPKYPKKPLQQYFLETKLPDYQVHEMKGFQIKNHHYYNDNFNIWNNPHQANKKNYESFHAKQIEEQPKVEFLKVMEHKDREQYEQQRRHVLSQERSRQLERLHERRQERVSLQSESQQPTSNFIDGSESGFLHRTAQHKSNVAINGRAGFLWNKMNKLSNKYIQQVINPKIISMDEQAVQAIKQKLQNDEVVTEIKEDLKQQNVEKIRDLFHKQHNRNMEKEKSLGLIPDQKPQIQYSKTLLKTNQATRGKTPEIVEDSLFDNFYMDRRPTTSAVASQHQSLLSSKEATKRNRSYRHEQSHGFVQKFVDFNTFVDAQSSQKNQTLERLSKPKRQNKSASLQKNPLDRTEFKGLLVSEVDNITLNLKSNFNKTMLECSMIVKENLAIRPATNKTRSLMKMSPENIIEDVENDKNKTVMSELDNFDRVFKQKEKRIGFPNSQLTQMKARFQSSQTEGFG